MARAQASEATADAELARVAFQQALPLYDAGRFAEALDGFERSAALLASPNSRLYVARCLRELGRLPESIDAYDQTLADAQADAIRYAATRRAADEERTRLEPRIARVRLLGADALPPGSRVVVAGRAIPDARWSAALPVNPGRTTVEVQRPDLPVARHEIALNAGQSATLDVTSPPPVAPPPPPVPRPTRTGVWIAGGVALAGAAGALAFWAAADRRYDDLRDRCAGAPCPSSEASDIDGGRTLQTLTNVSLVVAAVGLAGVIGFSLVGRSTEPSLRASVGPGGVTLAGSF